nr:AAA family ATPase [Halomonas sp. TA6]
MAGVFTLGKATKEDLGNIQYKRSELSGLEGSQDQQKIALNNQRNKLQEHGEKFTSDCWVIYKRYERDFKDALRGSISSKMIFKDKILKERASNTSDLLSLEELKDKANTLLRRKPDRIDVIPTIDIYEDISSIEKDGIWGDIIVGKADVDIASLIAKLNNSDWVNQGRKYLDGDETCPFCQQSTIDNNFRAQIEDYFDESFENNREKIQSHKDKYSTLSNKLLTSLYQIEE